MKGKLTFMGFDFRKVEKLRSIDLFERFVNNLLINLTLPLNGYHGKLPTISIFLNCMAATVRNELFK
jgi:hypothetical protein